MTGTIKQTLQSCQTNLNSWIPNCPDDAISSLLKSSTFSFVVGLVVSNGHIEKGLRSALHASVASVAYSIIFTIIQKLRTNEQITNKFKIIESRQVDHAVFISGLGISYIAGIYYGSQPLNLKWTGVTTGLSYILTQPKNTHTRISPYFITIV